MKDKKFVTAINCIDGRAQDPAEEWLQSRFGADYVDVVTQPGPEKSLVYGKEELVNEIREKVEISTKAHKSHTIAIFGHFDCAGNPISREEKIDEIKKAGEVIKGWNLANEVLGLYINEDWKPEEVMI